MNAILNSVTGMCPKCRLVGNFLVTLERQQIYDQDGTDKAIEISTTHCESCGTFISRESREVAEKESDDTTAKRHIPNDASKPIA